MYCWSTPGRRSCAPIARQFEKTIQTLHKTLTKSEDVFALKQQINGQISSRALIRYMKSADAIIEI
jgi:hypothetical protein